MTGDLEALRIAAKLQYELVDHAETSGPEWMASC